MAVTIDSTNMVTPTNGEADATTGWTGTDTPAAYTTFFREATGCLGYGTSNEDDDSYISITSTSFDDGAGNGKTLFGWYNLGLPNTEANIGFGLQLGDGTNRRVYAVGGSDNYGHFVNGWAGVRLDGRVLPATFRNPAGGAPNLNAVTEIGYGWNYAIAAFGKVDTSFHDVIRYVTNGLPALKIQGGTTGARGTFAEIATDDASTATGKAYGVCRVLTSGSKAFELTFGIEFGAATGDTFFDDSNFQLVIVGNNMSAGNMDVGLLAGTGTNLFSLQDGVLVGVGTASNWDLSAAFETMQFNRMSCTDLGTITFPTSGGTLRESTNCVFNNCGQITIGNNFTFTGHSFNGSTDANGALLYDNTLDNTNVSNLSFNSDGTGHAIYITATGTYTLSNFTYSGYGANESTDAVIYNNSGGAVTINVSGGDSPTVRNGAGATTTVVAGTVTVTVNTLSATGATISGVRVMLETAGAGPYPYQDSVSMTFAAGTVTVTHTGHNLATSDKVVIRGAAELDYNGVHTITVTDANTYTYTIAGTPSSPATGTPVSSFVLIDGETVSGTISMSKVFGTNQVVKGRARKGTNSPYYKSAPLNGTVNNASGAIITATMLLDE